MKKQEKNFDAAVRKALRGKQVPILVLDTRWHTLFPKGEKPADVEALEDELNALLRRQGKLVNEIKDLKRARKKLMDGIVAGMEGNSERDNRKKDNQQRLLIETKERIQQESDELLDLPGQIKAVNEELMILGASYCFRRLESGQEIVAELKEDIKRLHGELDDKESYKKDVEKSMDSAYSLMHALLGHDVMNLFDQGKLR